MLYREIILRSAHTKYLCFVWLCVQTTVASLRSINWLFFAMETVNVLVWQFLESVQIILTSQRVGFILRHLPIRHTQIIYGVLSMDCCNSVQSSPKWVGCTVETRIEFLSHKLASCLLFLPMCVPGYQLQCKSVRLTVQYRLWSTVPFENHCEVFVFRDGATYWHSWAPR